MIKKKLYVNGIERNFVVEADCSPGLKSVAVRDSAVPAVLLWMEN